MKKKDPTKDVMEFFEDHAFMKASAKKEMEVYFQKKEAKAGEKKNAADRREQQNSK